LEAKDYLIYSLQELYDMYNKLDKTVEKEKADIIIEAIKIKQKTTSVLNPDSNLADRINRLFAVIIDGIIVSIPMMIFNFTVIGYSNILKYYQNQSLTESILFLIIGVAIFLLINGYLLYTKGQTVGKKLLSIKIVTSNEKLPTLMESYVLRNLAFSLLAYIPLIGSIILLVDILFIFREDRRCLHDLLAGTKVVVV
jgi:uncharacterized RDD family membrane protein YckC